MLKLNGFSKRMQRIFKYSGVQYASLTSDKELNIFTALH